MRPDQSRALQGQRRLIYLLPTFLLLVVTLATAAPICDYCGKAIQDSYIEFAGKTYHSDCFHEHVAPRCAVCGKEVGPDGVIFEDRSYHRRCYEDRVALRCSVCGGIIEGEYLVDHWGNKYHKYHEQEIASCSFCGRLLTDPQAGGGTDFDPHHKICHACSQTSVSDQKTADRRMKEIRDLLEEAGVVVDPDAFRFKLVTREELARLTGKDNPDQFGLTRYEKTTTWGFLETEKLFIYVLKGLPKAHFVSATAHELMHAWLFLNVPDEGEPQLVEGSCNGAAMLVLRQIDDDMSEYVIRQLEEEPDTVYGGGFRRVERIIDNRGTKYWLQHLRLDPEFPIGY